jgi:hypothetical protein
MGLLLFASVIGPTVCLVANEKEKKSKANRITYKRILPAKKNASLDNISRLKSL